MSRISVLDKQHKHASVGKVAVAEQAASPGALKTKWILTLSKIKNKSTNRQVEEASRHSNRSFGGNIIYISHIGMFIFIEPRILGS